MWDISKFDKKGKAMAKKAGQLGRGRGERRAETEDLPLYPLLHRFEKPIIAAVNGVVAGGGLTSPWAVISE